MTEGEKGPKRIDRRRILGGIAAVVGFALFETADMKPEEDWHNRRRIAKDPNLDPYPDWTKGSLRLLTGIGLIFSAGFLGFKSNRYIP